LRDDALLLRLPRTAVDRFAGLGGLPAMPAGAR
jgi:hypothetical protein